MRPIDGDSAVQQIREFAECKKGCSENFYYGRGCNACAFGKIIKIVENAPTIDQYGTWIPVSSGKLPETAGMPCLLTAVNKFEQIRVIKGFTNYMEGGKFRFLSNEKEIDIDCWSVIAWMPLPLPYREEKKDE